MFGRKIKAIIGFEPNDRNAMPFGASIGEQGVTDIKLVVVRLGDSNLAMYDIYKGEEVTHSMMVGAVTEIHYHTEVEAETAVGKH